MQSITANEYGNSLAQFIQLNLNIKINSYDFLY